MDLRELASYLNDYLDINSVPDYKDAFNGLQVEGAREVHRIATAVDACEVTINEANRLGADLLLVHHGLFWGKKAPLIGAYYRRVRALIDGGLALYSAHLPLDVHPEVGNNAVLARGLGLPVSGSLGRFEGISIGVTCDFDIGREELVCRIREYLGIEPLVIRTGPERLKRIGIISGGAGSSIPEAATAGCDLFLTGEGAHHTYFEAEERGINVIYAGHYATETVGVKALGELLGRQFGLECAFIDHPTGL